MRRKQVTQYQLLKNGLDKESFMIEKGEEPRSSAVKMKIRAKKIDRQREKWRNIKENQGFAAGCGSTSKIEICEKCCPRLDIGRTWVDEGKMVGTNSEVLEDFWADDGQI